MKTEGREESENVEDRRGFPMKTGLAIGGGGLGAVLIVVLGLIFGFDPQKFFNPPGNEPGGPPPGDAPGPAGRRGDAPGGADRRGDATGGAGRRGDASGAADRSRDPEEEKLAHFAKVIFHDTEVIWGEQFEKMG